MLRAGGGRFGGFPRFFVARMREVAWLLPSCGFLFGCFRFFALFVFKVERERGEDRLTNLRVRRLPAFGVVPEDAVQFFRGDGVWNIPAHAGRGEGAIAGGAFEGGGGGVEGEEILLCRPVFEGREVWRIGEGGTHVVGDEIEEGEVWEAEHEFHGFEHALVGVEGRVNGGAADVGTGDEGDGAVAVDVVNPVLGVVFDDEDGHFLPEAGLGEGFDDTAEGEVIVGDHAIGRGGAGGGAVGMVRGELEDGEIGEGAVFFESGKVFQEEVRADDIGDGSAVARIVRGDEGGHVGDGGFGLEGGGEVFPGLPAAEVFLAKGSGFGQAAGVFAVDLDGLAVFESEIPDGAAAGDADRIGAIEGVTAALVAGPHGVGDFIGLGEPLVAIGTVAAGGVKVIEENELAGEGMVVGCDSFAEHGEGGITVAFFEIAEDLIVGSVFLDDVDDVFDEAGVTGAFRNGLGDGGFREGGQGDAAERETIVFTDGEREGGELGLVGKGEDVDAAAVGVDEAEFGFVSPTGADTEESADGEMLAIGAEGDGVGVPGGGDEAFEGERGCVEDGNGIDAAAGDVEAVPFSREGEGGGGDAGDGLGERLERDGAEDGVAGRVDDGDRITVIVGDVEALATFVPVETVGVEASGEGVGGLHGGQVDPGDGTGAGDTVGVDNDLVGVRGEAGGGGFVAGFGQAAAPVRDVGDGAGGVLRGGEGGEARVDVGDGAGGEVNDGDFVLGDEGDDGELRTDVEATGVGLADVGGDRGEGAGIGSLRVHAEEAGLFLGGYGGEIERGVATGETEQTG